MQVIPVQYNTNRNISFSHYGVEIIKSPGYSPETYLLRDDLKWKDFVKYIGEKYSTVDRVNLVNHACSAGYESYSLVMCLINTLGHESQKFFPIIARDIDNDGIEYAKMGHLELCNYELGYIRNKLRYEINSIKNIFDNNFIVEKTAKDRNPGIWDNSCIATCKTDLKDNIIFEQSDIFNDKDLINKDNTILLFRNVWKYLGEDKVSELAYFLANNMKPSSLLVIGEYDWLFGINLLLESYGFKGTPIEHVYEVPNEPAKNSTEKFPLIRCWGEKMTPDELRICSYRKSYNF